MTKEEEWYNANARPGCPDCHGKGMLMYYWSHDEAKAAPCDSCFPDDGWAKATAANFAALRGGGE